MLRAQTAAAGIAVNAQLRADETKMKQLQRGDVLERLLKIMHREDAKLKEVALARGELDQQEHDHPS